MASIKVKFRPSAVAGHEGSIYYQVIHGRKTRQIVSGYQLMPGEWDGRRCMVRVPEEGPRVERALTVHELIRCDLMRFNRIVRRLDDRGGEYTCEEIVAEYQRCVREGSLFTYIGIQIARLKRTGRLRMAEIYRTTLNSFKQFRDGEDILLDQLTGEVIEEYEGWCGHVRRHAPNTVSFYMRNLRAIYRRAVEEELTLDRKPFRRVYTGVEKTVKRALPVDVMRMIMNLDLTGEPELDYARDMFLLSFMLRGMSIVDMAYLRKSDLKEGYVHYRRRKTGQRLTVAWTVEMQRILAKYDGSDSEYEGGDSDYLLPILWRAGESRGRKGGGCERWRYLRESHKINRSLKRVGKMVGAAIPLTMYVARHSWASAAKMSGIPVSVISEGMGHDSESTTQIYLASLDTSVVDHANEIIIGQLGGVE